MARRIHIVVAEPSVIIRSGIVTVLKRLTALDTDLAEICDLSSLPVQLCRYRPDVLIVDPSNIGAFSLQHVKAESGCTSMKIIALQYAMTDSVILSHYDEVVSIYDAPTTIKEKIERVIRTGDSNEEGQELSEREREIVVCVVKGLTNRQIAEQLFLSVHTVITHRRNITNKLQIHSTSGLTIYAIVNKLVEVNEIKNLLCSNSKQEKTM